LAGPLELVELVEAVVFALEYLELAVPTAHSFVVAKRRFVWEEATVQNVVAMALEVEFEVPRQQTINLEIKSEKNL
jgi:hypothetical protein